MSANCFPCLRSFEPTKCFNSKTVAIIASAVLLATITSVVIGALMIQYPASHWLILGIPSALALTSFVALCVSIAFICQGNAQKNTVSSPTLSSNPFEQ